MGVLTLIHIYKAPAHNRSCATQEDVMRMLQLQRRFACLDLCLSLLCAKSCYSHGSHTRVHCTPYTVHRTYEYSCDCAVKECHFYVINICSRSALTSYLPTLLHPPHHPLYIFTAVNHQEQQGINAMKTQFTVGSQIYLTWFCFGKHWLKMLILTYLNKFSFPVISNQRAGGNVSEFGQIPPPLCG